MRKNKSLTLLKTIFIISIHLTTFSVSAGVPEFDNDKPVTSYQSEYAQTFNTTWENTKFYNQWDMVDASSAFGASDIASGYLQFVWIPKRIIRSKVAYSAPYEFSALLDYSAGSNRGGMIIRAQAGGNIENLQESASGYPGFNREGIAFYPTDDGLNMIVQFTGVANGTTTPVTRIQVPKPTGVTSLKAVNGGTLKIEDFGTSIYVYYNGAPYIRINLSGKTGNIYTSGTVYDANMQVAGTFTSMEVEEIGKVAIAQRDAALRLYNVTVKANITPWVEPVATSYNAEYTQSFNTAWDGTKFNSQWSTVDVFDASDITSGYLQFIFPQKRILRSKNSYASPYEISTKIDYSAGSSRGGIVIRAQAGGNIEDLQESPTSAPGFNREGIAFYPTDDGLNMIVQFTGVVNGYSTPVTKIQVPKPDAITSLRAVGGGTLRIYDLGESIYVYYNDAPYFRIDLGSKTGSIYTSGTVYNANMQVAGTFSGMEVEAEGKIGIAQRDATIRLYNVTIKAIKTIDLIPQHLISRDISLIDDAFTHGYNHNLVGETLDGKLVPTLTVQCVNFGTHVPEAELTYDRAFFSVWPRDLYWGFLGWSQAGDDKVLEVMKSSIQLLIKAKSKNQANGQSTTWPLNDKRFYIPQAYVKGLEIAMSFWPWCSESQADFLLMAYNYWKLSGDTAFISSIWSEIEYVTQTLELLDTNGNSLPDALWGSYDYMSLNLDSEEPLMCAKTSLTYSSVAKLAKILGEDTYATHLENLAISIKNTMNKTVENGGLWKNDVTNGSYYVQMRNIKTGNINDIFIPYNNLVPMWCGMTDSEQDSAIFKKLDANFDNIYNLTYGPMYCAPAGHNQSSVMTCSSVPWLAFLDVYLRGKKGHEANRDRIYDLLMLHARVAGGTPFAEGANIMGSLTGNAGRSWDNGNYFHMLVSGMYGIEKTNDGIVLSSPNPIKNIPLTELKNVGWRNATYNLIWKGDGSRIIHVKIDGAEIMPQSGTYLLTFDTGTHEVEITTSKGDGLNGDYYNGRNFETKVLSRIDSEINFNWIGNPASGVNADDFSVRWTGFIEPRYSELYTFHLTADNGKKLWINNELLVDEWRDDCCENETFSKTMTLVKDTKYPVTIEMYDASDIAGIKFEWESNSQARELVSTLFSTNLTPCTEQRSSFKPLSIPGTIEVEDFDLGCQGDAYFDADVTNNGGKYRDTFVDIETCLDNGGGYNVGSMQTDEFLEYTLNVAKTGFIYVDMRVSCSSENATFQLEFNGANKTGVITVNNTGSEQTWATITKRVYLDAGKQTLKIKVLNSTGKLKLNKLSFYSTTGNKDITDNQNLINIFPNPSNDMIKIINNTLRIEEIKIIDEIGKEIYKSNNIETGNKTIDVSKLTSGVYFIKIISDKGLFTTKLIKQ